MTIAEVAQVDYTADCVWIDDMARAAQSAGRVLHAAIYRHRAAIAYRAARAEKIDPWPEDGKPEERPCSICRGVRVCDWAHHLLVMDGVRK